jgi:CelD/BcsL family acetyltransferase involved in cellulose biosynthesis
MMGADDSQVEINAYSRFDDAGISQQEWDAFVERSDGDIFMTRDWCEVWWKHYGRGRQLEILVFKKNRNLVGILPLYIDRVVLGLLTVKIVKIIGTDYSLYSYCLPLVVEEIGQVASRFLEYMETQTRWDLIFLGPISGFYDNTKALSGAFSNALQTGINLRVATIGTHQVGLGLGSFEDYLQSLGPNTRKNIKKTYTRLKMTGQEMKSTTCSQMDATETFGRFVAMHQKRWESIGMAGHYRSWPKSLEFHNDLVMAQAERGRLRLVEVSVGNEVIGYDYAYQMGNIQWNLLDARVTGAVSQGIDIGKVVWCESLKAAVFMGVQTIDYMRGSEGYKKLLGTKELPIIGIYLSRTSLLTRLKMKSLFVYSRLVHLLYFRLWRNRIALMLRLRQGVLARLWIQTHWFGEWRK